MCRYNKKGRYVLAWVLTLALCILNPTNQLVIARAQGEASFLNDRAGDIISSSPLQVPALAIPSGLTGDGVIVGIADSGLDKGSLIDLHPDLQSEDGRMPRVAMLKSYTDRAVPDDPIGHGTHMAATIAGSGDASRGQYKGIAPGASLYFQALLDNTGKIKLPDQLKDLFAPAYAAGVRIHVDGWGEESSQYNNYTDQVDDFVYAYPDFLPIYGAGNNGPAEASLTSEANSKNALVVGSSQVPRPVFSSEAIDAASVADSSSRGPAQGGRIKPDLLAPGSAIISACSRLTVSNFAANSAYTRMGGSSMAAAVAGGATALLEEYLKEQGIKDPSSALLKALLINGAQIPESGVSNESGFGILDLANTILPLEEGSTMIAANPGHLVDGQTLEYRFQVADSSRPFKATLAWIDSSSVDGSISPALVDNLDLQVIDPLGKVLLGNDFQATGVSDQKNNVEQVVINKPQVGNYTIRVHGTGLKGPVWSSHYALVYGQIMGHGVVKEIKSKSQLVLDSGLSLDPAAYKVKGSINASQFFSGVGEIKIGSDVYLGAGTLYVLERSWESGGIEILEQDRGALLVEMNSTARQGGYYLEGNLGSTLKNIFLNGKPVKSLSDIPNGVQVKASINPQLQTIYTLNSSYQMASGIIEQVDQKNNLLKLLDDERTYKLAPWTAVASSDKLVDSSDWDAPYGSLSVFGIETLTPSTRVSMMVAPSSYEVQYIKIERNMVVGDLDSVSLNEQKVRFENGKDYKVFQGARIIKDGKEAELTDLAPGDKISGVVLNKESSLIELQAFSSVVYGRVIYFNPGLGVLYLFDSNNRFHNLSFGSLSQVYKNGLQVGSTAISPGEWVRLTIDPDSGMVLRGDLGEKKQEDEMKTLLAYDQAKETMLMGDGTSYVYNPATQMTKGGYNITPDLLMPGEKIKITTLASPGAAGEFLARAEVQQNPQAVAPGLEASGSVLNGALIIRGSTTANKLVVFRQDGSREIITVNGDGSFNRILSLLPEEVNIRILALDTSSGGIKGIDVEIKPWQVEASVTFLDIAGSADRSSIEKLAGQGIIYGYTDGTYHPQQSLGRAEFVTMLGRAQSWNVKQSESVSYFKDNGKIPWWALGSVYFARERGIISGYPEGTFLPMQSLTRSEMVVILARLMSPPNQDDISPLPYTDSDKIPAWAKSSYYNIYQRGWLNLFGGNKLEPEQSITRAEAARFIDRVLVK